MSARITGITAHQHLAITADGYTVERSPNQPAYTTEHWDIYFQCGVKTYRFHLYFSNGSFVVMPKLRPYIFDISGSKPSKSKFAIGKMDAFFKHFGLKVCRRRGRGVVLQPIRQGVAA